MKYRLLIIFTAALIAGFGLFGRSKLSSYTDITADPDFIYDFNVAEIPSSIVLPELETMKSSLPEAPVILKAVPVGSIEVLFGRWQQRVRIEKVFAGEELSEGMEILITSERWKVNIEQDKAIGLGFVNFMQEGSEYLIFISQSVGREKDGTEIFRLQTEQYTVPVFCYKTCDNVIYPLSGETLYVPYREVSGNEFFAADNEALEAFNELKEYLTDMYN